MTTKFREPISTEGAANRFREPVGELPELRAACALAYQVVVWSVFNGPGDLKAGEVRAYIRALFGPRVDAALDSYIDEYAKNIPPEPPQPVGPDEVTVSVWPNGAMSLMHGHPPAVQVRYLRADLAEKLEARIRELHLEVCAVDEKRKVKPLNKCEIGAFRAAYSDASMMSRFRDAMAARGIEVGE